MMMHQCTSIPCLLPPPILLSSLPPEHLPLFFIQKDTSASEEFGWINGGREVVLSTEEPKRDLWAIVLSDGGLIRANWARNGTIREGRGREGRGGWRMGIICADVEEEEEQEEEMVHNCLPLPPMEEEWWVSEGEGEQSIGQLSISDFCMILAKSSPDQRLWSSDRLDLGC